MHFDYTDLTKPVPFAERLNYLKQKPFHDQIALWLLLLVDFIFIVIFLVSFLKLIMSAIGGDSGVAQLLLVTSIAGAVALIMPFILMRAIDHELRQKRFAAANNMTFYSGAMTEERNGLIFHYGDARRFRMLFTPLKGYIKEFGTYCYDIGSEKNRMTRYYGFVRVKLPRRLPNMVLDSRENNLFGQSGLPKTLSKDQVLELEGDFNKYFTLYAPKEYEQDALYIFTPDVMQAMVDAPNRYDGEIVDDDFYLYTTKLDIHDTKAVEELLSIADRIVGQLNRQASKYADERIGDGADGAIAASGVRLKTSLVPQALLVIMIVLMTYWVISFFYR